MADSKVPTNSPAVKATEKPSSFPTPFPFQPTHFSSTVAPTNFQALEPTAYPTQNPTSFPTTPVPTEAPLIDSETAIMLGTFVGLLLFVIGFFVVIIRRNLKREMNNIEERNDDEDNLDSPGLVRFPLPTTIAKAIASSFHQQPGHDSLATTVVPRNSQGERTRPLNRFERMRAENQLQDINLEEFWNHAEVKNSTNAGRRRKDGRRTARTEPWSVQNESKKRRQRLNNANMSDEDPPNVSSFEALKPPLSSNKNGRPISRKT